MTVDVLGKFVSKKVSKVRWRPAPHYAEDTPDFIIGTWDDMSNEVSLWRLPSSEGDDEKDKDPVKQAELRHQGDVTDLQVINRDLFAVSSTRGHVVVCQITEDISSNEEGQIEILHMYADLHKTPSGLPKSCRGMAVIRQQLATIGADASIVQISVGNDMPLRRLENVDDSMLSICWQGSDEVLTSNSWGSLKLWDLRSESRSPSLTATYSGDQTSIVCMSCHPSQQHIVASGCGNGQILIWDLRQEKVPMNILDGHSKAVSEVSFHPTSPHFLFSCSQDGGAWQWSVKSSPFSKLTAAPQRATANSAISNEWVNVGATGSGLSVDSLLPPLYLPLNSLSVVGRNVIVGGDREAVYYISTDLNSL